MYYEFYCFSKMFRFSTFFLATRLYYELFILRDNVLRKNIISTNYMSMSLLYYIINIYYNILYYILKKNKNVGSCSYGFSNQIKWGISPIN